MEAPPSPQPSPVLREEKRPLMYSRFISCPRPRRSGAGDCYVWHSFTSLWTKNFLVSRSCSSGRPYAVHLEIIFSPDLFWPAVVSPVTCLDPRSIALARRNPTPLTKLAAIRERLTFPRNPPGRIVKMVAPTQRSMMLRRLVALSQYSRSAPMSPSIQGRQQ
jgi:hypothetical protein